MKQSAGILLYKYADKALQVFLVHPGGPFWKNKDSGAWSIPKGEFTNTESALDAAIREVEEETGAMVSGDFIELTPVKQKSGKKIYAWAVQSDLEEASVQCSTFINIEWPPKSGKIISIPEIDKGKWFFTEEAKLKINSSQAVLIDELMGKLN